MNTESITLPIYYYIDDNGNKVLDLDLMRAEFEELLQTLRTGGCRI